MARGWKRGLEILPNQPPVWRNDNRSGENAYEVDVFVFCTAVVASLTAVCAAQEAAGAAQNTSGAAQDATVVAQAPSGVPHLQKQGNGRN